MRIETDRLIVRNFKPEDWRDLHEYLALPETYVFEPGDPIDENTAKSMADERSRGDDFLAVVLKTEGKMVGHLYFHRTEPADFLTWELGYIFNPKYQRKGYATEASVAIVRHAFAVWKAHRVVAFCNPENPASWRVLEKIGMVREGHFRQKAFFRRDKDGNPIWHDAYAYGIVRED